MSGSVQECAGVSRSERECPGVSGSVQERARIGVDRRVRERG